MSFFDRLRNLFKDLQKPKNNEEPFKIYTTTMVNTLTLSSDMETLYLIDNGRSIAFPLNNKDGILIGTLRGQITVATGLKFNEETDTSDEDDSNSSAAKRRKALKLPVLENTQWTASYNKPNGVMAFIGATEIDFGIAEEEEPTVKCHTYLFDLKSKVVNIRRLGNAIEIVEMERKG